MSELKHFKGKDWEIKIKYDEEMKFIIWKNKVGEIPLHTNNAYIENHIKMKAYGVASCTPDNYKIVLNHFESFVKEDKQPELTLKDWFQEMYNITKKYADYFDNQNKVN